MLTKGKVIKIYLLDGQTLVLDLLYHFLNGRKGFEVVKSVSTMENLLKEMEMQRPDVIVADLFNIESDPFEAATLLRNIYPWVVVLLVTEKIFIPYLRKMNRLGIKGLVSKNSDIHELLLVIKIIAKGGNYVLPHLKGLLDQDNFLTIRETEIAKLLTTGWGNGEIAHQLSIGIKTVESHKSNIYRKLNIKKIADLVKYMYKRNLTD